MPGPLSISSILSHEPEAINLKIFFANGIDIWTTDHDILNKYVVHEFNQYTDANTKDYSLWNGIQVDFEKLKAKHFDEFDGPT